MSFFYPNNDDYGFTFSPPFFEISSGNGNNLPFLLGGMDYSEIEIINEGRDLSEKSGTSVPTKPHEPLGTTATGNSSSESNTNHRVERCAIYFSVILIILIGTGMISSFLGFVDSAIHWKRNRNYHQFLHIFAANLCLLVPLSFAVASRLVGQWSFGDAWFKILTTVTSAAQTACAFHLANLVLTCCRQVLRDEKIKTNGWDKIFCYALWLIAFASAWPCAIYESILCDVIKGHTISGGRTVGAGLYIKVNTAVSFIFPSLISLCCILVVFVRKAEKEGGGDKKLSFGALRDVKEVALLSVLFFACWLPYRAWRIKTLSYLTIPGCGVPPDIFLYISVAFSTLLPLTHCALGKTKPKKGSSLKVLMSGEVGSGNDSAGSERNFKE